MDMMWVTDFKALKALFPCGTETAAYDHGAVTEQELEDLVPRSSSSELIPEDARQAPDPETEVDIPPVAAAESDDGTCTSDTLVSSEDLVCADDHVIDAMVPKDISVSDVDGLLEAAAVPDQLPPAHEAPEPDFEVPDVEGGAELIEGEADYLPEISGETRARQLASEFLRQIGELTPRHVDWISEIILKRRWSTAKSKVIELYGVGHRLKTIHRAFELSEAWRDCECLDERLGDAVNQSWYLRATARISWLEAIKLVSFVGEDASVEDILAFVESERYLWRQTPHLVQRFPRFKHYLLDYRISSECKRPSLGWYRTLDPSDGRFFDGCINPEYTSEWWDEEIPCLNSPRHTARRIFIGAELSDLVPEQDDGILWWEE